jgi:hypothetical protein
MPRGQVVEVGKLKALGLAIPLVTVVAALGGCGSDGEETAAAAGGIPSGTADRLAEMSDEIAAALEAGDVCGAAQKADDLQAAVSEAEIPAELRPEVEAGAAQLVNVVNCDSEQDTTTKEDESDEDKQDEEEGEEEGNSGSSEGSDSSGPPGQDPDFVPPGQAKIKGGI